MLKSIWFIRALSNMFLRSFRTLWEVAFKHRASPCAIVLRPFRRGQISTVPDIGNLRSLLRRDDKGYGGSQNITLVFSNELVRDLNVQWTYALRMMVVSAWRIVVEKWREALRTELSRWGTGINSTDSSRSKHRDRLTPELWAIANYEGARPHQKESRS
jgi:hypothetical protein